MPRVIWDPSYYYVFVLTMLQRLLLVFLDWDVNMCVLELSCVGVTRSFRVLDEWALFLSTMIVPIRHVSVLWMPVGCWCHCCEIDLLMSTSAALSPPQLRMDPNTLCRFVDKKIALINSTRKVSFLPDKICWKTINHYESSNNKK